MNVGGLLGSVLGGVLGARRKPHARALDFLTGNVRGSHGSFLNASTLLTAAALGWGAYEIYRTRSGGTATTSTSTLGPTIFGGGGPVSSSTVVTSSPGPTPPPVPPSRSSTGGSGTSGPTASAASTPPPLPPTSNAPSIDPVRRLVGILLAAARSDGELGEREYGRIVEEARKAGGGALVSDELARATPIEILAGGIDDPRVRGELYQLAYAVIAADDGVQAAERAWLGRLATILALDAATIARLERAVNDAVAPRN